ncbi:MAG TPA: transglutaminase domain-containing protein, partial [Nitrospiria bacterium]|nr:transglutaminase domain-containing protein [Nitrospiria bacterium]
NPMGALSFPSTPATRVAYTVTSQIPALGRQDAAVTAVRLPPQDAEIYFQLPDDIERVRDLALEVTDPKQTQLQKVLSIEGFLEENYRYTLNVRPPVLESPVEDFLFSQKAGFCEHYATSMVLMLRALDIPARLVTGFLPGEWNEIGRHFTVRQSNAHAWVEVWFPESGWYPFDPTPVVDDEFGLGLIAGLIDSLQWKWTRYVISYSLKDQIRLASGIKSEIGSLKHKMAMGWEGFVLSTPDSFIDVMTHPAMVSALLLMLGVMVLLFFKKKGIGFEWKKLFGLIRSALWSLSGKSSRQPAVRFYFRMLEIFRKRGVGKPPGLTPKEFIQEVSRSEAGASGLARGSWASPAKEITAYYYQVRFAGLPLSPAEERRVEDLLSALKQFKGHS